MESILNEVRAITANNDISMSEKISMIRDYLNSLELSYLEQIDIMEKIVLEKRESVQEQMKKI